MEELSSNLSSTFLPSIITKFLNKLSSIPSAAARAAGIDEFVRRLEEEVAKIDAFKRELPICMVLLRDVIRFLEKESIRNIEIALRETEPELEEFVPLRKCKDVVKGSKIREEKPADLAEKKDWMSSAKLWSFGDVHSSSSSSSIPNPDLDPQVMNDSSEPKNKGKGVLEIKDWSEKPGNAGGGMGFMNLKRHCTFPSSEENIKGKAVLEIMDRSEKPGNGVGFTPLKRQRCTFPSSMNDNKVELMMKNPIQEDLIRALSDATAAAQASSKSSNSSFEYSPPSIEQQQGSRKQRRCWGPELHNAFLSALAKLGGEKVATPKQIREVMKVDGLTNDEVKSHLQKYRIYTRKMLNGGASQGNEPWNLYYECGESSKASNSQSPEGPLHLVLNSGVTTTSITGGDSIEEEDDEKTESHSWKKSPLFRNNRQ